MARSGGALQHRPELAGVDPRVEAGRVQLVDGRREQDIDSLDLGGPHVGCLVSRIPTQVVGRVELRGVDEQADHHHVGRFPRRANERQVPVMEGAHGGHQTDALAALPRLAKCLAHLRDRSKEPHGRVASASAR